MPLVETRIAELLLRRLAREMKPGECRELMGWANQCAGNRQQLEELTSPRKLINKLRNFYNNIPGEPGEGPLLQAAHEPISSASADTGFLSTGV